MSTSYGTADEGSVYGKMDVITVALNALLSPAQEQR